MPKVRFRPIDLAAARSSAASDGGCVIQELVVPSKTLLNAFVGRAVEALKARAGDWHLETATDDIGQRNPKVDDLQATVARVKFGAYNM